MGGDVLSTGILDIPQPPSSSMALDHMVHGIVVKFAHAVALPSRQAIR